MTVPVEQVLLSVAELPAPRGLNGMRYGDSGPSICWSSLRLDGLTTCCGVLFAIRARVDLRKLAAVTDIPVPLVLQSLWIG